VVGDRIYIIGGTEQNSVATGNVDVAFIGPDGTIGAFGPSGAKLVNGRVLHVTVIVRNSLYVIGGTIFSNTEDSIERAVINADGTLGPFTVVGAVAVSGRAGASVLVTDDFVYVIGGELSIIFGPDNHVQRSVERAAVHADGTLGPFSEVPAATLITGRTEHESVVVGKYLYVQGGAGPGLSDMAYVERASINGDGSLGPFESVPNAFGVLHSGAISLTWGNAVYVLGGTSSDSSTSIGRVTLR
jgi:Kelch motif